MEHNQILNQDAGTPPNIHSEQIKEEFYKWFESRGLLAELRAYMRQLMVKALEENNKNGNKKWQKKSSTSPKLQAINLLVVDYLFHEDYFYTVSVFASEAHILDSLPQYSRYVTESVKQRRWDPNSLPRFSRQETEDILDTLHIPPTPFQQRQAADSYRAGRESLLACIVRTMVPVRAQSSGNGSMEEEEVTQDHSHCSASADAEGSCCYQLWSQEMQQLLLMAGLKLVHIHRMQHKWAQTIENERQQARREAEEEFAAREAEWQREVAEQLQEERTELQERQSRVEIREQSLVSLAEQLTVVHEDVTQRLSQLQLHSDQLEDRALQQKNERLRLQQKMRELRTREENLGHVLSNQNESAFRNPIQTVNENPVDKWSDQRNPATKEVFVQVLPEEEFGITVSTQTLNQAATVSTQTLDVTEVASTQTVDTTDHELQTSLDQPDPELVAQLELARRNVSELQEENLELRAHILQQRHRIDELTNRAANLSSQLEESQVAVAVLSGRESALVASAPAPPPPPPPPMLIAPTFGFRAPHSQGGGEESLFSLRPPQTTPRADGRRRPLRFAFSQQPSPTSEESSPTDEVIQNARSRIQQLEQESISIQRTFQDFQTRLLTTDSLMFPPLRASRTSDPLMRVRRSEIGSTFPTTRLTHPPPSFDNINRLNQNRQQLEVHEDSRSEFYDTIRIENLSSSRRLFNQRNIRHYERWKQFKKKFQKRDGTDYSKRNFKAVNSNTSSEDDDGDVRNLRRRQDIDLSRRDFNAQIANIPVHQANEIQNVNNQDQELSAPKTNKANEENNKEIITRDQSKVSSLVGKATFSKAESAFARPSKTENKIELDLKRSAELIESVKVLLEAQSIKESGTTTLSNGSLAVESLPRDSDNSHIDIGKTDSSIVTVQNVNPSKANERRNMTQTNCDTTEQNIASQLSTSFKKPESQTNFVFQETQTVNQNQQSDNKKDSNVYESNCEKLNTSIPGSNVESEDLASNFAVTSSDVAEVESGDRATTSLTSGSDILRELNPSKTDSSSSVISAGFGEDSKHSSDFWD